MSLQTENDGQSEKEHHARYTTINETIQEIQIIEASSSRSRAHQAMRALTPFISFVERYSPAVDSMVQFDPKPSCLIWGSLRVILRIARSIKFYYDGLFRMIERLGNRLSIFNKYHELFGDSEEFHTTLSEAYVDALEFLNAAKCAMSNNGHLLLWLRRAWKNFESEFKEIDDRLSRRCQHLESLTTLIHRDRLHSDVKKQEDFRERTTEILTSLTKCPPPRCAQESYQEIMAWLSPIDWSEDLLRIRRKRSPNSCRWLTDHSFFHDWTTSTIPDSSIGWVYGRAGVGKTVASSAAIETLQNITSSKEDPGVILYFFFSGADDRRMTTLQMYQTIISQLLSQARPSLLPLQPIFEVAKKYGRSHLTWADDPVSILRQLLAIPSETFLIVDAIDECEDVESFLPDFLDVVRSAPGCRTLLLSRDIPALRRILETRPRIRITPTLTKECIDEYITNAINEVIVEDDVIRADILQQVSNRTQGMFLWASLMIQELKDAISPEDMTAILNESPPVLNSMYRMATRKMEQLPSKRRQLAKRILSRAVCSVRPLTWKELQTCLAFDSTLTSTRQRSLSRTLPYKSIVLKLCSPFIEHHLETDTFRLSHMSVHQYLTATEEAEKDQFCVAPEDAHRDMAAVCLEYLIQPEVHINNNLEPEEFPFTEYATSNWCHHLIKSKPDIHLHDQAVYFLSSKDRRQAWLSRWILLEKSAFPLQQILRLIHEVGQWLSSVGPDVRSHFDEHGDALDILVAFSLSRIQDPQGELSVKAVASKRIGQFERMMVIRELAREYTIAGRIGDGVNHVKTQLSQMDALSIPPVESVWLHSSLGLLYDQQGEVDLALSTQQKALSILLSSPSHDEFEAAQITNELGRLYRHQRKYKESEEMHLKALTSLRQLFPATDFQTTLTLNTLARCYRQQGRLEEALAFHNEAIAVQKTVLGLEHPHTLWVLSDIAKCHRDQGDMAKACELQEESVRLREKVLGPTHHDTLWALNDLAVMYEKDGRVDESFQIHSKALDGQKDTLGVDHKATVWTAQAIENLQHRRR